MTSTDNPDQTPSDVERHGRAVLDMLSAHDCEVYEALSDVEVDLDDDVDRDIGERILDISYANLQISLNRDTVQYRQQCLRHRGELDQLLTTAGIEPAVRQKVMEALDAQARTAEHFHRAAPATA